MHYFFTSLIHRTDSRSGIGFLIITMSSISKIFILFLLSLSLISCSRGITSSSRPDTVVQAGTVTLPTSAPTPEPTPVNTRVLPVEALTPGFTPTITPIPEEVMGLVVDVIDGDTIAVVLDGDPARQAYQVRYIGIEAPENLSGDPWGVVAYEVNEQLTKLKIVRFGARSNRFRRRGIFVALYISR